MGADIEVQKAIRARLVASPAVTALVPATGIVDSHQRPAPRPGIILGESQLRDEGTSLQRAHTRVWHTLHIWKREPSLEGVKAISAAVRGALRGDRLSLGGGYHLGDLRVSDGRSMRDPDGETSHAVLTVECLVVEP
ncbi:DUF3168 domain-containing protein [Limimaricola hongkongensis]|uniref:DUF3168 domain-containing protein n=1 Tax=Limimaricola hongkongensis TaxID=278132 RepID=UPI00037765B0|nr:DUF3168 domain-containing protein [Limimaricola hongkongensis]